MIKIIKNTMKDPIKMKCSNCFSEFEYNYEDIKEAESTGVLGVFTYRYVKCPVCKIKLSLKDKGE